MKTTQGTKITGALPAQSGVKTPYKEGLPVEKLSQDPLPLHSNFESLSQAAEKIITITIFPFLAL